MIGAPPEGMFSRARLRKGGGPPAIGDKKQVYGPERLRPVHRERIRQEAICRIVSAQLHAGGWFLLAGREDLGADPAGQWPATMWGLTTLLPRGGRGELGAVSHGSRGSPNRAPYGRSAATAASTWRGLRSLACVV